MFAGPPVLVVGFVYEHPMPRFRGSYLDYENGAIGFEATSTQRGGTRDDPPTSVPTQAETGSSPQRKSVCPNGMDARGWLTCAGCNLLSVRVEHWVTALNASQGIRVNPFRQTRFGNPPCLEDY